MNLSEALEEIEKAIEEMRERNKNVPILVEGEKDALALQSLGISGEIITIHCGKKIANLCDYIASHYKEIIILTDWDRRGWRLCKEIERNLEGRTKCITEYRLIFAKNSMVKDIEGMPSFLKNLKRKVKGKRKLRNYNKSF
ncbi:MAG: toprim domain-containing protein [Thermoplasmata archaeon]|nr:toprim domain-containing protein [Thermoplasmata archaeon]